MSDAPNTAVRTATLFWTGLALALLVPNLLVAHKEKAVHDGTSVYLELAPLDPRSLMQGDYMRLRYALVSDLETDAWPDRGALVVRPDPAGVGRLVGRFTEGTEITPGDLLLRYTLDGGRVRLEHEEFFFPEGEAARFNAASYAELRVAPDGRSVLVNLLDEHLRVIEGRPSARF